MIYGGFDPAFIDIDIQPINQKKTGFIKELPKTGSHHINTKIDFQPGGNGFNLCRTLATLGRNITYVGPSSTFFEKLVKDKGIPVKITTIENVNVNYTTILNMLDGEIQFNSVQGNLSIGNLTPKIINYYRESPLKPISNVALNASSVEWISSLLLSLVDENILDRIENEIESLDLLTSCSGVSFDGIIFIDPSDISKYDRIIEFSTILKQLSKFEGEKYLSVNEHELATLTDKFSKSPAELSEHLKLPIIFHSAEQVIFYGKEKIMLKAKELERKVKFVGAGDCFNGAFLDSIFDSCSIEDSLSYAIDAASHLIETGIYPDSLHISKRINS